MNLIHGPILVRFKRRDILKRKYYKTESRTPKSLLLLLSFHHHYALYDIIEICSSCRVQFTLLFNALKTQDLDQRYFIKFLIEPARRPLRQKPPKNPRRAKEILGDLPLIIIR